MHDEIIAKEIADIFQILEKKKALENVRDA